jgi:hypothetical protein
MHTILGIHHLIVRYRKKYVNGVQCTSVPYMYRVKVYSWFRHKRIILQDLKIMFGAVSSSVLTEYIFNIFCKLLEFCNVYNNVSNNRSNVSSIDILFLFISS